MNELRLFDPLALDPFEDTFRSLMKPWRMEGMEAAPRIKLDLSEFDGNYKVKAEIPGVRKEDIDVRIDGNVVSISAIHPSSLFICLLLSDIKVLLINRCGTRRMNSLRHPAPDRSRSPRSRSPCACT